MEYCIVCGKEMPDYEPKMCCDSFDCGCGGLPVEPAICSERCYDNGQTEMAFNKMAKEEVRKEG